MLGIAWRWHGSCMGVAWSCRTTFPNILRFWKHLEATRKAGLLRIAAAIQQRKIVEEVKQTVIMAEVELDATQHLLSSKIIPSRSRSHTMFGGKC